jgi:hypothetical protein
MFCDTRFAPKKSPEPAGENSGEAQETDEGREISTTWRKHISLNRELNASTLGQ